MEKSMIEVAHETVKGLHKAGLVDKLTMHEFDALCSPKVRDLKPKDIKGIRERENLSQPVLAKLLNVSPSSVKHWEIGDKHPGGAALKLLNIVDEKGIEAVA